MDGNVINPDDLISIDDLHWNDQSDARVWQWRRSPTYDFMVEVRLDSAINWAPLEGVWHGLFVGAYVKDRWSDVVGVIVREEIEDTEDRVGIETLLVRFGSDDFQECYLEQLAELRDAEEN